MANKSEAFTVERQLVVEGTSIANFNPVRGRTTGPAGYTGRRLIQIYNRLLAAALEIVDWCFEVIAGADLLTVHTSLLDYTEVPALPGFFLVGGRIETQTSRLVALFMLATVHEPRHEPCTFPHLMGQHRPTLVIEVHL